MKPRINTRGQEVPTRFRTETRFVLEPKFAPLTHDAAHAAFEDLKTSVLQPVLTKTLDLTLRRQLHLAANEAAAAAWTTPFPLLFLPALLEEKASEVHRYVARQQEVEEATQDFIGANL
jgi:hypothetical protein